MTVFSTRDRALDLFDDMASAGYVAVGDTYNHLMRMCRGTFVSMKLGNLPIKLLHAPLKVSVHTRIGVHGFLNLVCTSWCTFANGHRQFNASFLSPS